MTGHPDHFAILDGTIIGPQSWMQLRRVATNTAVSVSKNYDPSGGGNKDEQVHTVTAHWTNDTPISQWVFGRVTRGGAAVTLQARSRGYLADRHGFKIGADGDGITMTEVSRVGVGLDIGKAGVLAVGTGFGVAEHRVPAATTRLMPHTTGMTLLTPGQRFNARAEVRFKSEFWESTLIDGGDEGSESGFISGDTRIDLYALPVFTTPAPRPSPSLVGTVNYDTKITSDTEVDVPAGVTDGDTLIAIVANQLGLASAIEPTEDGWTLLHAVNEGPRGVGDVHMKIWMRPATDDEPDTYTFTNGLLAQQIAAIVAVRDASSFVDDGWYAASALRRFFWQRHNGHIAPSIDRAGKFLLTVSYFKKSPIQGDISQAPPLGMTEIADIQKSHSSMAIAALINPPAPTGARAFTPSETPQFTGRSITASVLIPGTTGV